MNLNLIWFLALFATTVILVTTVIVLKIHKPTFYSKVKYLLKGLLVVMYVFFTTMIAITAIRGY